MTNGWKNKFGVNNCYWMRQSLTEVILMDSNEKSTVLRYKYCIIFMMTQSADWPLKKNQQIVIAHLQRWDLNPPGPPDFKSGALTTQPRITSLLITDSPAMWKWNWGINPHLQVQDNNTDSRRISCHLRTLLSAE